jgi:hypothetical protein
MEQSILTPSQSRARFGAVAFCAAAILFVLYPVTRPWNDDSDVVADIAVARAAELWAPAHTFAAVGFLLAAIGVLAIREALDGTRAESWAFASTVVTWLGVGLVLPYYGAEAFGLHAIAAATAPTELAELAGTVEFGPLALTMFGAGLLILAIGGVLTAVTVWRSNIMPRWSGLLYAVGFATFLPQFFASPALRIAHGVALALGMVWLAIVLWRRRDPGDFTRDG